MQYYCFARLQLITAWFIQSWWLESLPDLFNLGDLEFTLTAVWLPSKGVKSGLLGAIAQQKGSGEFALQQLNYSVYFLEHGIVSILYKYAS